MKNATCEALNITDFNIELLISKVNSIEVLPENKLIFKMNDGTEKLLHWEDAKRSDGWTDEMRQKARERSIKQYGKSN